MNITAYFIHIPVYAFVEKSMFIGYTGLEGRNNILTYCRLLNGK